MKHMDSGRLDFTCLAPTFNEQFECHSSIDEAFKSWTPNNLYQNKLYKFKVLLPVDANMSRCLHPKLTFINSLIWQLGAIKAHNALSNSGVKLMGLGKAEQHSICIYLLVNPIKLFRHGVS